MRVEQKYFCSEFFRTQTIADQNMSSNDTIVKKLEYFEDRRIWLFESLGVRIGAIPLKEEAPAIRFRFFLTFKNTCAIFAKNDPFLTWYSAN